MTSYKYSDFKLLLQDYLRDEDFTSDYSTEVLRAINLALDDINLGDTGEPTQKIVGFNFQKMVTNVSHVSGTEDYTFLSLSISENTFKFPNAIRINSDEDTHFTLVKPGQWYDKIMVQASSDKIFTVNSVSGARTLKIKHSTTETLNFEYFTNNMIAVNGAIGSLAVHVANDDDTFLFPDWYVPVLLNFTLFHLFVQKQGVDDPQAQFYLGDARKGLKKMILSDGVEMIQPVDAFRIRSEMNRGLKRISRS